MVYLVNLQNKNSETIIAPENLIPSTIEGAYELMNTMAAKPVEMFVPLDGTEQRDLFLEGKIRNPSHVYERLLGASPEENAGTIRRLREELPNYSDVSTAELIAYDEYAALNARTHDLIAAAQNTHSSDPTISVAAAKEFMTINVEVYGEPDKETYGSLIGETRERMLQKSLSEGASVIRSELMDLLPEGDNESKRTMPTPETMKKMQIIAEHLYGGMLSHIPKDVEQFAPEGVAEVFRTIIDEEFGEAAAGWRVEIMKATSIGVSASEKLVKIPENRKPVSPDELRRLIVHELGVHMLRSITGSDTDLPVLSTGLSGYYDAEEGLGKVIEQAIDGQYKDAGIPSYLISGMMYFEGMDFRSVHDIMWRKNLLDSIKPDQEPTEADVNKAKLGAYRQVFRIARGTDNLPWFKDLVYYNGTMEIWKYCEKHADDYDQIMFLMAGKYDPTNVVHQRIIRETHTV